MDESGLWDVLPRWDRKPSSLAGRVVSRLFWLGRRQEMHGRAYGDDSERDTLYHEDDLESMFKPEKAVTQHTRDCV